jgi:hypothetical protein
VALSQVLAVGNPGSNHFKSAKIGVLHLSLSLEQPNAALGSGAGPAGPAGGVLSAKPRTLDIHRSVSR